MGKVSENRIPNKIGFPVLQLEFSVRFVVYSFIFAILIVGGFTRGQQSAIPDPTDSARIRIAGALAFISHGDPNLLIYPPVEVFRSLAAGIRDHDYSPSAKALRYQSLTLNKTLSEAMDVARGPILDRYMMTGNDDLFLSWFYALAFIFLGIRIESLYLFFVFSMILSTIFLEIYVWKQANKLPVLTRNFGPVIVGSVAIASLTASDIGDQAFTPINGRVISILGILPLFNLYLSTKYLFHSNVEKLVIFFQLLFFGFVVLYRSSSIQYAIIALALIIWRIFYKRIKKDKNQHQEKRSFRLIVALVGFVIIMHTYASAVIPKNSPTSHPIGHSLLMGAALYSPPRVASDLDFQNCDKGLDFCVSNLVTRTYDFTFEGHTKDYASKSLEIYLGTIKKYPLELLVQLPINKFKALTQILENHLQKVIVQKSFLDVLSLSILLLFFIGFLMGLVRFYGQINVGQTELIGFSTFTVISALFSLIVVIPSPHAISEIEANLGLLLFSTMLFSLHALLRVCR